MDNSILNNVVYLYIDATSFDPLYSEIIRIDGVKIKEGNVEVFSTSFKNKLQDIKKLMLFIEVLPIICEDASFTKRFLEKYISDIKNEILDLRELCSILEPWRRDYRVISLIKEVTSIDFDNINKATNILYVLNSFLCRLWDKEEEYKKKNANLYNILKLDYNIHEKWGWAVYLQKPLFFNYNEFNYVKYNKKQEVEIKASKKKIPYNEFEKLLRRKDIWNRGGDFNYQYREEQEKFSFKIRENIEREERIFIEAPTGSGKTFAYLLIGILQCYKNLNTHNVEDASFIISTDTKELQNQLVDRDIPNMLEMLGLSDRINFGYIKGKGNYLCPERLAKNSEVTGNLIENLREIFLKRLCEEGEYGDIEKVSQFAFNHFNLDGDINKFLCDSDECNLDRCYKKCYLRKRYNELPQENITVVNHSLLASWPYGEKKKITHLIIDEAHNLMDKCSDFFADEFESKVLEEQLEYLYGKEPSIFRILNYLNASLGYREVLDLDKLKYLVSQINLDIQGLLVYLNNAELPNEEYNFKIEYVLAESHIKEKLKGLDVYISKLKQNIYALYSVLNKYFNNITLEGEEGKEEHEYRMVTNYILKLKSSFDTLDSFIEQSEGKGNTAKEFEISKDNSYFRIRNIPLNVDELFNEQILNDVKSVTFLSATLRINNSFLRIKSILGQEEANEWVVPPTFNLRDRTRIITLKDIGRYNSRDFIENSSQFIYEMAVKLNGHILVLFTNNLRKQAVEDRLNELVKGSKIEVHSNKKSIRYLSDRDRQVIILGSKGFFEGIDLPGDALTAVILDKIPNKSIEDPLLKAIVNYRKKDYRYVNYPQLCIKVKQVYGRLIRSTTDYGYFCILDGGTNNKTLLSLQRDLGGPIIENISKKEVLRRVEIDYYRWNLENLRSICKSINGEEFYNSFIEENKKRKSFFKININNGRYEITNMNFKFIK